MIHFRDIFARNRGYLAICAMSLGCAAVFALIHDDTPVPVLGQKPLFLATLIASVVGWPILVLLQIRAPDLTGPPFAFGKHLPLLIGLSALLAVPPIFIDLFIPFPRDINVLPPAALVFYPAIALVAEVAFHLLPLAFLGVAKRGTMWVICVYAAAILAEPVFQAAYSTGAGVQAWLVVGNVSLISAVQIWLFRRFGFSAMFGLRLFYYFFWHIAWGSARLGLLF